MNDKIDELKQSYRDINAPPHVATRIRAEVADRPLRRHSWIPLGATAMAIIAVIVLAPIVGDSPTNTTTAPTKPSLSAIASLMPGRPANSSVNLSQLRTAKKPKLPLKPRLNKKKPQSNLNIELEPENDLLEEKNYEFS